jgi:FtsP/CotA-like multicopper oxidase with cupredoxin domain
MGRADVADVYYPAFLINGKQSIEYPDFKPGEKVRVRVINGGASTSLDDFWGEDPVLVSSDGHDVVPVVKNKTFIGVSETYDFIVTIPEDGKIEYRIMAQDGSGTASAFLGSGKILAAQVVPGQIKLV